jgi:hypothetical protein
MTAKLIFCGFFMQWFDIKKQCTTIEVQYHFFFLAPFFLATILKLAAS